MRVIIYCRTNRESEGRFREQMEETAGFCRSRGYGVVETVRECCTGSMAGPLLKKAVADCREGKADAIAVRDVSRIGRNCLNVFEVIKEMESFGGTVMEAHEPEKSVKRVEIPLELV